MIFSTATVPVNPPGEVTLTREQLWSGLVLKARDPRLFLPPGRCTKCDVVFEGKDFIVREAVILGDDITEVVSFIPQRKVSFHQLKGPREGVIVNEILEDPPQALQLKFYCYLGLRDFPAGSEQERQEQTWMDSAERGYRAALLSTLAMTRSLVKERKL
jgi:hypothetical protein